MTPTVHERIGALVPAELLELLRDQFPLRVPDIEAPERHIWAEVGRQDLIAFLAFCRDDYHTPHGKDD